MTITAALSTALPTIPDKLYLDRGALVVHEPLHTDAHPIATCGWPPTTVTVITHLDVLTADGYLLWCSSCWTGRRCQVCGVPSGRWVQCGPCAHDLICAEAVRAQTTEHQS